MGRGAASRRERITLLAKSVPPCPVEIVLVRTATLILLRVEREEGRVWGGIESLAKIRLGKAAFLDSYDDWFRLLETLYFRRRRKTLYRLWF